ncbi:MAG: signal recognition particle receptor FtsY [Candidatus Hydrogenedentota bacterium]
MAEVKRGFFGKLRDRLSKTRDNLSGSVRRVFGGRSVVDDDLLEELEEIFIGADFGVEATMAIIEDMRALAKERRVNSPDAFVDMLKEELTKTLQPGNHTLSWQTADGPHVTLIAGVNGSGKTTTAGKLSAHLTQQGKTVMLGAADTFRAAAVEQLTIWSERTGVPIIKHKDGADPAAVAFDAADAAASRGIDCLLIDTAGRLHTKVNLMEELKKIQRVVAKRVPGAPHEVLLVLDATTGQNGLQQAKVFTEALHVTGIVLTKLDGTAKGGIAVAIQRQLGIPIKLIGVGEAVEDLQPFNAREFVDAIFS